MSKSPPENLFDQLCEVLAEQAQGEPAPVVSAKAFAELTAPAPKAKGSVPAGSSRPRPDARRPASPAGARKDLPASTPDLAPAAAPSGSTPDLSGYDLPGLERLVAGCTACPLHRGRANAVFGDGPATARLMFIGEGPGRDEDRQGKPFVGRAGQLLTRMIEAMQFRREEVYIANIVKCRPPENRVPMPEEAATCLPYLNRQIALVQPEVIVLLGATAVEYLLGLKGISRLRGQWLEYRGIRVMPTFHPAYLLRNESKKKEAWGDLQQVMRVFGKTPSGHAAARRPSPETPRNTGT